VHRSGPGPQSNDFASQSLASQRPPIRTAPSGIAQQLRRSADQQAQLLLPHQQPPPPPPAHDTMNLDDFIFSSSVGSPAGLSPDPSIGVEGPFSAASGSGVPIRKTNQPSDHNLALAHASAPPVPPQIHRENEFGYVPRHVRKTSIDERRVSALSPPCLPLCLCLHPANLLISPPNDEQKPPRRSLPSTASSSPPTPRPTPT